jgi:hypothetical protein
MAFRLDRKMKITKVHRLGGHQYPHPRRNRDHVAGPQGTQHRRHRHGINSGRRRNNLRLLLRRPHPTPGPLRKTSPPAAPARAWIGQKHPGVCPSRSTRRSDIRRSGISAVGGIEWPLTLAGQCAYIAKTDSRRAPRRNTAIAVFECGNTLARFVMCG